MIVIIFIIIIPATRRLPPVTHHPTSVTRHPRRSPAALIFPGRAFYVLWLLSCRQSYPQFPQSPLGPPGTMTSLLAHAHKKRKRNGCIFRVSQLTYAGLNSRIVESERNKCKNIKKCMFARWMCSEVLRSICREPTPVQVPAFRNCADWQENVLKQRYEVVMMLKT